MTLEEKLARVRAQKREEPMPRPLKPEQLVGALHGLVHKDRVRPPAPTKPCPACGSNDWWYREPSALGGKSEWCCECCHPGPEIKER
jgi:hypothetical protein